MQVLKAGWMAEPACCYNGQTNMQKKLLGIIQEQVDFLTGSGLCYSRCQDLVLLTSDQKLEWSLKIVGLFFFGGNPSFIYPGVVQLISMGSHLCFGCRHLAGIGLKNKREVGTLPPFDSCRLLEESREV